MGVMNQMLSVRGNCCFLDLEILQLLSVHMVIGIAFA